MASRSIDPAAHVRQAGATLLELMIALPVMLLLGLGMLQLVLIYQTRLAVEQAVTESARAGSTGHAQDEALQRGLARGLAPLMIGADDAADLQRSEARALARVAAGLADGSISLARRSPTDAAFGDWEVPALDPFGDPIVGQAEIPNDNLDTRRLRSMPTSGVSGYRGDEPIGAASSLTLVDANVLRVELVYGARLTVPIVGRLVAATLRRWQGCSGGGSEPGDPAGTSVPASDICRHLAADPPRLPLRAVASVRMMSPARRANEAPGGISSADPGGGQSGGLAGAGRLSTVRPSPAAPGFMAAGSSWADGAPPEGVPVGVGGNHRAAPHPAIRRCDPEQAPDRATPRSARRWNRLEQLRQTAADGSRRTARGHPACGH
jgi:hypothetical protein